MSIAPILAHLFLVLAILAGGLAPGVAAAETGDTGKAMSSPCHDMADELDPPSPADCCDDGACGCDCLQLSPAGFLAAQPTLPSPEPGPDQRHFTAVAPVAAAGPEVRPPIA